MNRLKNFNADMRVFRLSLILIYVLILVMNLFTPYTTDDYAYMYSWDGGGRITSILQIFPSMHAHILSMNGRVMAHFFVQLSLIYPKLLFNIINSLMFVFLILLLYEYRGNKGKTDNMLIWGIFFAVCFFARAFGQVFLWLDGSCNYLWSMVVVLAYLVPYLRLFQGENIDFSRIQALLFACGGIVAGGWLESSSFSAIFVAVVSVFIYRVFYKKKIPMWAVAGIGLMLISWIFMISAPGTRKNKMASLSISTYMDNFIRLLNSYKNAFMFLVIAFLILLIIAIYIKSDRKRIYCGLLWFAAHLISHFMHIAATYYESRSFLPATIFIILAIISLLDEKMCEVFKMHLQIVELVFGIYVFCFSLLPGIMDIYSTYEQHSEREAIIEEYIESENMDISLPLIVSSTKYSAKNGLKDLDTETADTWPNIYMSKYYGVNSIIGY